MNRELRIANTEDCARSGHFYAALSYWVTDQEMSDLPANLAIANAMQRILALPMEERTRVLRALDGAE
jgi:hypothetical protein